MSREDEILAELRTLNRNFTRGGGGSPTGGGGATPGTANALGGALTNAGKSSNFFTKAIEDAQKYVTDNKDKYAALTKEIETSMGSWRDFTKSGISFNNDIVGMSVAAKGARVDMGEFASTVKDNAVLLAGFGGGIGKGAQEFAALAKKMYDAGESTDSLRQLGYTNKELNDILALQAGMIGSSMKKGEERDAIAIQSAQALAYEMDAMAKLTGKSREAQMESQKKLAADAAYQAKLDYATRNMGEKEAAEYRAKVGAEYAKAEAAGLGQTFKETFTYGQVMSKTAATEQAIAQKAGVETARAAQAASAGNFEESSRRLSKAQEEAIAMNKSAAFQQQVIFGQFSGAAGEASQKQFMANKALTDTVKAIEKEPEHRGKSNEELRKIALERIKEEQNQSAGSTKAAVNVEQRMKDLGSVIGSSLIDPLNKQVNPELNKFATAILGARTSLVKGAPEKGMAKALEDQVAAGREQAKLPEGKLPKVGTAAEGVGFAAEKAGGYLKEGIGLTTKGAEKLGDRIQRQGGSLEMAGKLFENWGQGTMVELHGLEGVVRPDDMKKILSSSMSGMGEALKSANQKMPEIKMPNIKMPEIKIPGLASGGGIGGALSKDSALESQGIADKMSKEMMVYGQTISKQSAMSAAGQGMSGFDLGNISKNINTSLSGLSSSIKIPDIKEFTSPFENTFKNFTSSFKSLTKTTSKAVEESYDEFKGLDEAIAKQMPFDEFAGLDEFIAKQIPFDEFAGLDEFIAKQIPFDEFAGLDEAIAKHAAEDSEFGDLEAAMAKVSQDVSDEFGDLAGAMKDAAERMYPDTEFGDLDGAMAKVASDVDTEFGDLDGAMAKVASDVDTEFGDLAGAMKRAAEDMYPDTEFGDLEGAMAKVSHDIDTEFGDLDGAMKYAQSQPYDEFGDLDGAIAAQQAGQPYDEMAGVDEAVAQNAMDDMLKSTAPTTAQQPGRGKIDINSFTLSKSGLPIAKPKSTKTAVPDKPAEKQASPGKAINPETGEEYTPVGAETASKPGSSPASKSESAAASGPGGGVKATLDDVVKALTALNTKVGQLVSTSEQGFASVARSNKSMSNNLYERAKA